LLSSNQVNWKSNARYLAMHKDLSRNTDTGKVWLVGAGPGDAELLTLKAVRAIENADIIFYDQLVSGEIRALFPAGVPALYVGKAKNHHSIAQEDLNQILIDQAKTGLQVCRIKGGDPFVFGRGGEELLALREAGVEAQVIPGITAASGCSASAEVPLTHRGLSQGCTFVTAHADKELKMNWRSLAQLNHTLVFYMGVTRASIIATELQRGGMSASTPAAIIENGSRDDQRVFTTMLSELEHVVIDKAVQSPALIVIGEVVSLRTQLQPEYWRPMVGLDADMQRLSA
jgi:uroporphyrin-III C-methyltransferase